MKVLKFGGTSVGDARRVRESARIALAQPGPRVLDPYGAESPAEFFGVASEAFFQRGAELAQHHPRLYGLLRAYYGFDTD